MHTRYPARFVGRFVGPCLLGMALHATPTLAADRLVLAMPTYSYQSVQGPWLTLIYTEAFARLGLHADIIPMPTKRASVMASSGLVDGDLHRGYSYGAQHPDLVRVEQSHFTATFAAYGSNPKLRLAPGWDGFRKTDLRVTYILGSVTSTEELTRRVAPEQLSAVPDPRQGLRKLEVNRCDVLVALDQVVDPLLELPEYQRAGVHKLSTLGHAEGYLYLNKKYAALAPRLAQVLAQMKREHRIEQLEKLALQDWKPQPP